MTVQCSPYPAYKPSGIPWLGDIPAHWKVGKLKQTIMFCQNGIWGDEPDGKKDLPCVRVADFDRTRNRINSPIPTLRSIPITDASRRMLKNNDLLIEKSGGGDSQPVGTVVLFDLNVSAVCSNFIARIPAAPGYFPSFLCYLHTFLYSIRINTKSIKQNTGIQNLDTEAYFSEFVGLPPLPEQQAIAAYLDGETARLDALADRYRRLLVLLDEKRRTLITQAVTRGLDPTAPLKDSGIEWLGQIPAHWVAKRLKNLVSKIGSGKTPRGGSEIYSCEGVIFIRSQNVHFDGLHLDDVVYIDYEIDKEMRSTRLQGNDILLNITGASLGRATLVPQKFPDANVNQHVSIIRPKTNLIYPPFLNHIIGSSLIQAQIFSTENGAAREGLPYSKIANLVFAMPENYQEQQAIATYLDQETTRLDGLKTKIETLLARLGEYRAALISAAVTGKIDVTQTHQELA